MNPRDESVTQATATTDSPAAGAWRDWLDEFGPRLLLFARQQTRSAEDAQDVLQDALVKLVGKINTGEFSGGQEAWMPYLYTAIRRLSIDAGRKDDRRRRREDIVSADEAGLSGGIREPWFEGSTDDESRALLEGALKEIPDKYAEVITMKIWGEQTFAQIGEALEISQNTAASRYRYGLEALRKALSGSRRKGDLSI